jgi:hypothetical protein
MSETSCERDINRVNKTLVLKYGETLLLRLEIEREYKFVKVLLSLTYIAFINAPKEM